MDCDLGSLPAEYAGQGSSYRWQQLDNIEEPCVRALDRSIREYVTNFAVATATLPSVNTSKLGAFRFFGGVTTVAVLYIYIFVPETKSRRLEEMEELFGKERRRMQNARRGSSVRLGGFPWSEWRNLWRRRRAWHCLDLGSYTSPVTRHRASDASGGDEILD